MSLEQDFDYPAILRVTDSFGKSYTRKLGPFIAIDTGHVVRVGDRLWFEVSIDPTYLGPYEVRWEIERHIFSGNRLDLRVEETQIAETAYIFLKVCTLNAYHRFGGRNGYDDHMTFGLRVLPAIKLL